MSLKSTFLALKNGTNCPNWGEGGEVIWTKSKRTAVFFVKPSLEMIWQLQRTNTQKNSVIFGGRTLPSRKCILKVSWAIASSELCERIWDDHIMTDLCIYYMFYRQIWKRLFCAISGIDSWQQRGLESFFAFDIPAGWHWWRGAGLSYSSLLTLKTAADQLTQQVAMMF